MLRAESKGYGRGGERETRQAEISVDVGYGLGYGPLEAGKMSSCEKGRSSLFLKFRVPSYGSGTVQKRRLTSVPGSKKRERRQESRRRKVADKAEEARGGCRVPIRQ